MGAVSESAKQKQREITRQWQKDNPARSVAATKRWRKKYPKKAAASARRANLKSNYGITPEWFIDTILEQGGCAICKATEVTTRGGWNTDHDHKTNKVRGVLCGHCNRALGLFNDDPGVVSSATSYLLAHKKG